MFLSVAFYKNNLKKFLSGIIYTLFVVDTDRGQSPPRRRAHPHPKASDWLQTPAVSFLLGAFSICQSQLAGAWEKSEMLWSHAPSPVLWEQTPTRGWAGGGRMKVRTPTPLGVHLLEFCSWSEPHWSKGSSACWQSLAWLPTLSVSLPQLPLGCFLGSPPDKPFAFRSWSTSRGTQVQRLRTVLVITFWLGMLFRLHWHLL